MSFNGLIPWHNPNIGNVGQLVKSTPGKIGHIVVTNLGAAQRYLKIYDTATAPVVGTATPIATIAIPNAQAPQSFRFGDSGINEEEGGIRCLNGIGIACTTSYADTDTTNPTNGDVQVNVLYR